MSVPVPAWNTTVVDESSFSVGEYVSLQNIGETLYMSYYDSDSYNQNLKFSRVDKEGDNWVIAEQTDVDTTGERGPYTSLAVDDTAIYISYFDWSAGGFDLVFAKSIDNGVNWDIALVDHTDDEVGYYTSIDVEGTDVYISYFDWGSNGDLKFVKSQDGGATWPDEPIAPLQSEGSVGRYTHLQAAGDSVYILYYDPE